MKKPLLKELSIEERDVILPVLIKLFKEKTDDRTHLTQDKIVKWFISNKEKVGFKCAFNLQRFMKLTNYIRANRLLPLLSTNDGYYVTRNKPLIRETIQSLKGRIEAQISAIEGLEYMLYLLEEEEAKKEICSLGFDWDN